MYADRITPAMAQAIDETNRRRAKQVAYNLEQRHRPDAAAQEDRRHHRPARPRGRRHGRAAGRRGPAVQPRQGAGAGLRRRRVRRATSATRLTGAAAGELADLIQQLVGPDARGGRRAAVRAGRAAARRDLGDEEGAPADAGRDRLSRLRWARHEPDTCVALCLPDVEGEYPSHDPVVITDPPARGPVGSVRSGRPCGRGRPSVPKHISYRRFLHGCVRLGLGSDGGLRRRTDLLRLLRARAHAARPDASRSPRAGRSSTSPSPWCSAW